MEVKLLCTNFQGVLSVKHLGQHNCQGQSKADSEAWVHQLIYIVRVALTCKMEVYAGDGPGATAGLNGRAKDALLCTESRELPALKPAR